MCIFTSFDDEYDNSKGKNGILHTLMPKYMLGNIAKHKSDD